LWLLPPEHRELVRGLIVNKFRGDLSLFDSGVDLLQERGGVPVLGVLPWIESLELPEEDAVALDSPAASGGGELGAPAFSGQLEVAVIRLPHIANFDDFDPLESEPNVQLRYVHSVNELGCPDVVILPGTKNTFGDLQWLRESGLARSIERLAQQNAHVVGICGGYQMLGRRINNPRRLEGGPEQAEGLGLLDMETTFHEAKQTCQVELELIDDTIAPGALGQIVSGYEIHNGRSEASSAWLSRVSTPGEDDPSAAVVDGSHSNDGRIWGCYLHGLFHNDRFRSALLCKLGATPGSGDSISSDDRLQAAIDRLADAFESHIDFSRLMSVVFESLPQREAHESR
jgi:adenosylcobyric acid synthase